jgi:hypothetical protein
MQRLTFLALGLALVLLSSEVAARSGFVSQIPHGGCDRCHIVPGGPRNAFGQDVQRTLNGGPNWRALYDLDSDNDGFTNGEELGDPDGLWPGVQAGPMLSEPGDNGSFPTPVGARPEAEDAAFTIDEDEEFEGEVDASDADGDELRYRLSGTPELGTLVFLEDGAFRYSPDPGVSGIDTFNYRVSDGHNPSVLAEISMTIRAVNDAPIIDVDDRYRGVEGRTLSIRVEAEDEEDGELEVELTSDLPEGASWDPDGGRFSWVPGPTQSGDYEISFRARDSEGLTAEADVSIEVADRNAEPVIESADGPETALEGEPLQFSVTATDADDDELTYTWNFPDLDAPVVGVDLSQLDHTFGDDGRMTVTVTVSDGINDDTHRFVVEVENISPVVDAGEDMTVQHNAEVRFAGSFEDPGDETYQTRWNFGDGTALVNDTLTPTHVFARQGTFTVVLSVEDGRSRIDDSLTVTVVGDGGGNNGGNNGGGTNNGEVNNGDGPACVAGQSQTCLCDNGAFGRAECAGGTYLPCLCGESADSEPDEGCATQTPSVDTGSWYRALLRRR